MAVKRKIFEEGKIYTYDGTEGVYSVVMGEVLEGDGYPLLSYGDGPPTSGSGKNGDIYIDKTNFKLYTRGSTNWDSGVNFKGATGPQGATGASGNALTGYLTNETHTVPSTAASPAKLIGANPLSPAGGSIVLVNGTSILSSSVSYSMVDETSNDATYSWRIKGGADSSNGLKVRVNKSTGVYDVSETSTNAWTSDTETFDIKGTYSGTDITKVYKITKSKGATIIKLKASGQTFRIKSDGTAVNGSNKIYFTAKKQGHAGTGGGDVTWKVYGVSATGAETDITTAETVGVSGSVLTVPTTSNTDKLNANMTASQFLVGIALPAVDDYASLKVEASFDGTEDEITVNPVSNGSNGADGASAITGYLTNEVHTVAAYTFGDRINKDELSDTTISNAGGTFKVFDGITDKTTSATFSLPSQGGTTGSSTGVVYVDKNGLRMEINTTTGAYTLKVPSGGVSGWTSARGENFTLRATYGGVSVDKVYKITKNKTGESVVLTPTAFTFNLKSDETAKNAADFIQFTAKISSVKGAKSANDDVTWTVYGVDSDGTVSSAIQTSSAAVDGTYLQVIAGNDLTIAKMTIAKFITARSTYYAVKVRATYDTGVYDEVTINPSFDGADGADAITGYLTNESDIVAADADGVVSSFAAATGSLVVQRGESTVSSSVVYYAGTSGTGTTQTLNGLRLTINSSTGAYSLAETSSGSWSSSRETFTVRAVYSGVSPSVTVTKTYKISKAIRGIAGSTGPTGLQGVGTDKYVDALSSDQTLTYNVEKKLYFNDIETNEGNLITKSGTSGSGSTFTIQTGKAGRYRIDVVFGVRASASGAFTASYTGKLYIAGIVKKSVSGSKSVFSIGGAVVGYGSSELSWIGYLPAATAIDVRIIKTSNNDDDIVLAANAVEKDTVGDREDTVISITKL